MPDTDPAIEAAFGGTAPPEATTPAYHIDPAIENAFPNVLPAQTRSIAPQPYAGGSQFGEILDIARRHPFSSGWGLLENAVSGTAGTVGKMAGRYADLANYELFGGPLNNFSERWGQGAASATAPVTPAGKEIAALGQKQSASLSGVVNKIPGASTPLGQTLQEAVPEAATDVAMLYGAGKALKGAPAPEEEIESGHPLSEIAQKESARLEGYLSKAREAGLEIPEREISPHQQYLNNLANEDLDLPKGSPVTEPLIRAGMKRSAFPDYAAVRNSGTYELGPQYEDIASRMDMSKIDPELRPPTSGSTSGRQSMSLSQNLRDTARDLYEDAENRNLITSQRQAARSAANQHYAAAKLVEAGFREHAEAIGQPELADNWDAARPYVAKANTWMKALDGAGNVVASKIRKAGLADEPISGALEQAAGVAGGAPEQFKSTRIGAPTSTMAGRVIKRLAPVAGAAIGGAMAPGVVGPVLGSELVSSAAEKLGIK